ncbi:InlB B-repeat-containing protein, partial [Candidatus Marithrix sp. Canyon 246]|uniref:InlB B-repeat-containing protein n=1 Tax=Candidatus Marithrix sp. Canyon 246 TaxID=1827136 RepID=UPI001C0C0625
MKKYTKIAYILGLTASSHVFSDICVIDESVLSSSNKIHYSLGVNHPSGSISSSRNIISLKAFTLKNGYKLLKKCKIGSFKNQSDKYRMYYSSDNKPPKGYDRYAIYNNTEYKGFSDGNVYASNGKSTLINLITKDISLNKCWKWASNYSGGNLDRNDNFWTYFCPKQGLVDYIANAVKEKTLPIKLETNISPKDSGTITKSPEKTSYSPNEEVTLTATPAEGYKFKQWQGDASGTEDTITIKMNGNQNVTAVFEEEENEQPPTEISSKA